MNGQDLYNPPILYQVPEEDVEEFKEFIDTIIDLATQAERGRLDDFIIWSNSRKLEDNSLKS